jgi:hypothetical protein
MGGRSFPRRDRTFLQLAAFAAAGGVMSILTSVVATIVTWRHGHPNSTFFFFSLWGLVALVGAVANVVVYYQSGNPPPKPPRGGQKVTQLRLLETRPATVVENDRKAA